MVTCNGQEHESLPCVRLVIEYSGLDDGPYIFHFKSCLPVCTCAMSSAHSLLSCHINFAFMNATSHSYHFIKYLGLYFVNKALSVYFCSTF